MPMRTLRGFLLMTALFIQLGNTWAGHPTYLVLRAPARHDAHGSTYERYPGYGVTVSASGYSYGWFGARPQRQWSRQFGYYRNYTQWSGR